MGRPERKEVFRVPSFEKDVVSRNEHNKLLVAYQNLNADFIKLHAKYEKLAAEAIEE